LQAPGVMSFGQPGDPLGGGREQDTMAGRPCGSRTVRSGLGGFAP
jgi:hypothetical protein